MFLLWSNTVQAELEASSVMGTELFSKFRKFSSSTIVVKRVEEVVLVL